MAKKRTKKEQAHLNALIGEATVDCYSEIEEFQGFANMIEENVVCPFKAKVLGEEVEVIEFHDPHAGYGIDAVCRYKDKEYRIDIRSLEWPKQKPAGYDWIEAYQYWLSTVG